jgi:hypothetical protein
MLVLSLLFWFAGGSLAREVTVTGVASIYEENVGSARTQALKNAQREAVEQGVGAYVDANTLTQNFEIIRDEIFSASQGFIREYQILREGRSGDGSAYEIMIRADVQDGKIVDKLTALRVLHQKMGNKRVMVVYSPTDPNALPRDNGAVSTTLAVVRDEFNRMGFRVFNERAMEEVYRTIEQSALVDRPVDGLIALALDQQAEVLVRFEMVGGKRDQRGGVFYATKATVRLSVYDANTGRQIADVVTYGKELSANRPGTYDWFNMLGKAGTRAGIEASQEAVDRIIAFYQNVGDIGNAYLLVFRNYSVDQEDMILDYLEGTAGYQQLSELKNTRRYMEIELFSSEDKSRLRRKMRQDLLSKDIPLVAQEASGNRIVFVNPRPSAEIELAPPEKLEVGQ